MSEGYLLGKKVPPLPCRVEEKLQARETQVRVRAVVSAFNAGGRGCPRQTLG